ncbi:hypothetical protein ABPG72_015604 [Tetrahymena utriculariae]
MKKEEEEQQTRNCLVHTGTLRLKLEGYHGRRGYKSEISVYAMLTFKRIFKSQERRVGQKIGNVQYSQTNSNQIMNLTAKNIYCARQKIKLIMIQYQQMRNILQKYLFGRSIFFRVTLAYQNHWQNGQKQITKIILRFQKTILKKKMKYRIKIGQYINRITLLFVLQQLLVNSQLTKILRYQISPQNLQIFHLQRISCLYQESWSIKEIQRAISTPQAHVYFMIVLGTGYTSNPVLAILFLGKYIIIYIFSFVQ